MRKEGYNIQQDIFITRFNEFAKYANDYLGIPIAQVNDKGCCFALAQYHLKHDNEDTLHQFYECIETICTQFTKDYIPKLLTHAKITDEQKIAAKEKTGQDLNARYHEFRFKTASGSMSFEKLMDFAEGISKAQLGYESRMAKGRFIDRNVQYKMGRFESIAGNWESSYVVSGTKVTLVDSLTRAHLGDYGHALIMSGNHAINYCRSQDNQFMVYDSNDQGQSKKLKTLDEVADAIMTSFERVGNLSSIGHVTMSIDTVTFGKGDQDLKKALLNYRTCFNEGAVPTKGIATTLDNLFREFQVSKENQSKIAEKVSDLCSQLKEDGKVKNTRDFVRKLPHVMQTAALECLNYQKRAEFSKVVEGKTSLNFDPKELSANQKIQCDKINEYLAQYHEGFLSRADFSANVTRVIQELRQNLDASEESSKFQSLQLYNELMQLEKSLKIYLDNTITGAELLRSTGAVDLNARDNTGYSLLDTAFEASPNLNTIKSLFERGEKTAQTTFDINNVKDYTTIKVLLSQGNTEVTEYLMGKIDMNKALSANKFELLNDIVASRNIEVTKCLVKSLLNSQDEARFDINQKIDGKSLLHHALAFNSPDLLHFSLENKAHFSAADKAELQKIAAKSSTKMLDIKFNKIREGQDYSYEQFKKDHMKKHYTEADYKRDWDKIMENDQAMTEANQELRAKEGFSPESPLKPYTYEQFQQEYADEFNVVNAWASVVEKLGESENPEIRLGLFNALINEIHLEPAEKIFLKEAPDSPQWKTQQAALFAGAVNTGNLEMVTRLIKQQEQLDPNQVQGLVNTKTKDGRSVLSGACKFGHNKIVDELVKGGAQIKEDKALPLSLAVGQCNLDICRKLLAQGASFQDCSSIDKSKHLVNMIMSNRSKEDQKRIVSLLLTGDSNIPVNSQSIDKQVVHDAIAQVLKDPKGQYEDIKLLVDTFDVTLPEVLSTDGKSLTVLALEKGDLALFDTLIKNTNPSLNDTSNFLKIALDGIRVQERAQRNKEDKYKPDLHVALVSRAKEWIEDNPALSNQSFDDGTTPLMRAAESGHVGTAELIIKKGAEINTVKSSANSTKIHEPESTLMAFALRSKSNEMIAFLAGKEVDLTLTDSKGLTPMQSIVSSSRPTFSEVMMLKGSKQDLQIKDDNDNTLLHLLVNRSGADKSLDLIRELLKAGLDPCQKNKEGVSPIQMALGTDKTQKNIPVVVAMMESMSAKTLSQDDVLRESLKPHKSEILECFKSSFKDTDLNSSASKVAATDRLKQVFDLKNALGHLYRTKIRIDKPGPEDKMTPQSLVGRFHLDNKVMKELKGFKASFLDEGEKKRTFEITRPKQWRNL